MESLLEDLTRGNVVEVKVVLASAVLALAAYQVFLMAVGYGKLRLPFLGTGPASSTHRAVGDAIVVLAALVAFMCVAYSGFEEDGATLHALAGVGLLAVLALKVVVVRRWHRLGRLLPVLGISVFVLFALTWLTSAADVLA